MTHLCIGFVKKVFLLPRYADTYTKWHSLFVYLLFFICSTNRKPIFSLFLGPVQIHRHNKFALFCAKSCQIIYTWSSTPVYPRKNWWAMMEATLLFHCHCRPLPLPPPLPSLLLSALPLSTSPFPLPSPPPHLVDCWLFSVPPPLLSLPSSLSPPLLPLTPPQLPMFPSPTVTAAFTCRLGGAIGGWWRWYHGPVCCWALVKVGPQRPNLDNIILNR